MHGYASAGVIYLPAYNSYDRTASPLAAIDISDMKEIYVIMRNKKISSIFAADWGMTDDVSFFFKNTTEYIYVRYGIRAPGYIIFDKKERHRKIKTYGEIRKQVIDTDTTSATVKFGLSPGDIISHHGKDKYLEQTRYMNPITSYGKSFNTPFILNKNLYHYFEINLGDKIYLNKSRKQEFTINLNLGVRLHRKLLLKLGLENIINRYNFDEKPDYYTHQQIHKMIDFYNEPQITSRLKAFVENYYGPYEKVRHARKASAGNIAELFQKCLDFCRMVWRALRESKL